MGCRPGGTPKLHVLGVHTANAQHVVFVQVTNPANVPMHLTKLEYTFAASGQQVAAGELPLARDVPGDSTVVLEVPLDALALPSQPLRLEGQLTAEQADLVRTFPVAAEVN